MNWQRITNLIPCGETNFTLPMCYKSVKYLGKEEMSLFSIYINFDMNKTFAGVL